ncbi:MAG: hypothetical protein J0L97_00950 [Alphaproteobacteria bacterium]|nr:hypothetical protein [Alphaproteobacteria bacterium]
MVSLTSTQLSSYASKNLNKASNSVALNIARLSSGNRIARASDDIAALSIGTSLMSKISTQKTALTNTQQANALLSVADGALGNITDILQQQLSLATQANSGTLSATERGFLDQQFQALSQQIDSLVTSTKFNNTSLIDGSLQGGGTYNAVAGANSSQVLGITGGGNAVVNGFNALSSDGQNFTGGIQVASVTANGTNYDVTLNIGGEVFSATNIANNATSFTVTSSNTTFTGANITFQNLGAGAFTGASNLASVVESNLSNALNGSSLLPNYQVTGFLGSGNLASVYSNTVIFAGQQPGAFGSFSVDAVSTANNGQISVDIGGNRYTATGVQNTISNTSTITFNSTVDNTQLRIGLTGLNGTFNFANAVGASDFVSALNDAFANAGAPGVGVQVGTSPTDDINITLANSGTGTIYGGAIPSVSTQAGASDAVTTINAALDAITAQRAQVGAFQSQFDYAGANLETAIQNQDAARSVLMDTDIASESAEYAENQVKVQAGISVLAQANLMKSNFLKLLGQ